ncbi:porin [Rahnella bruchi]|uniref:porin n=1 Tax=Rahnella bruchi TaxID=1510573 RepID=UPI001FCA4642|nr:porin [Rahnella bruchi]
MVHSKYMKRYAPLVLVITTGVLADGASMAADNETPLQAAPAYTATQTKGETVWSDADTSVGVLGSVRMFGKTDSKHSQKHDIQNNDSRLGVAVRHNFDFNGGDSFSLGYYETGIHGLDSATDDQGNDVYTRQAYAGLGSDEYGIVTFGKQYAPTDWALGVDTTYAWGGKGKHNTAGMSTDIINSAAIYYYSDDHLTLGLMGQGNDTVDSIGFADYGDGPKLHDAYRDGSANVHGGAALGGQYLWDNGISVSGAVAYNNYTVNSGTVTDCTLVSSGHCYVYTDHDGASYDGNTYSVGATTKYTANVGDHAWSNGAQVTWYVNKVNDVKAATLGSYRHNQTTSNAQETLLGLEYNSQFKITPEWGVYADYSWLKGGDAMEGQHFESAVFGTDYWLGKNAVTYVEYGYEKAWGNDNKDWNTDDHLTAVGLRIFI